MKVNSVIRRVLSLAIMISTMVVVAGCGANNVKDDTSTIGNDTENINNDNDGSQVIGETKRVDKSKIGVTMELSGEYSDCNTSELTEEELNTLLSGAVGGFKISKTINSKDYTLANIMVVKKDLIGDPQVRGMFPYIYEANTYAVVATSNPINDKDVDVATADKLNSGMINQLMTIFFDESVFEDAEGNEVVDASQFESDTIEGSLEIGSTEEIIE